MYSNTSSRECGEQGEGIAWIILASLQANIRRYDAPLQIPSLLLPFRQYNTHTPPFFIELSDEKRCLIAPYQQAHPPREAIFPCDTFPISKVATHHPSNRHIQVPPPYLESSIVRDASSTIILSFWQILVVFRLSYIRASVILIASNVHFMASEAQVCRPAHSYPPRELTDTSRHELASCFRAAQARLLDHLRL